MKIIDALKELPLIEKKVHKNAEQVEKYASYGSHVGAEFEDQAQQEKELKSLLQSNKDLLERYRKLKLALSKTNNETVVTINDKAMTITEWIIFRNKTSSLATSVYNRLTTRKAESDIRNTQVNLNEGQVVGIVKCYQEKDKNNALEYVADLYSQIDATLERVNATTDLVVEV